MLHAVCYVMASPDCLFPEEWNKVQYGDLLHCGAGCHSIMVCCAPIQQIKAKHLQRSKSSQVLLCAVRVYELANI